MDVAGMAIVGEIAVFLGDGAMKVSLGILRGTKIGNKMEGGNSSSLEQWHGRHKAASPHLVQFKADAQLRIIDSPWLTASHAIARKAGTRWPHFHATLPKARYSFGR
jgi:hypothetical protein